ncbi:MAG: MFS transporter [Phycisphaerales bacterium]
MSAPRPPLPRTVVILGWVSYFADVGSEMAYPVLPLFLAGPLQAPKIALGLVEGAAQLLVSVSTAWSGVRSDTTRRVPFVRVGYALPALGRGIVALATAWPWVLSGRLVDRLGKGLRTSPRDALIGDAVEPGERGHAFGFHRSMDNAGSFTGVLIGVALLWWLGASDERAMRWTIGVSAVLGLAAVVLTFLLRESPRPPKPRSADAGGELPRAYWRGLVVLVIFALANSSDTFLLLRGADFGLRPWQVALSYAGFAFLMALLAWPLGRLSDRIGRWPLITAGVATYALSYAGFASASNVPQYLACFALYGVSSSCVDGVQRALVVDHVSPHSRGKGLGIMHASLGVASLAGSVAAGALWDRYGAPAAFWLGAALALVALVAIALLRQARSPRP